MKERMLYKTLVVGVIVLFVGMGVQPAIATVQIEKETVIIQKIKTQIEGLKNKLDTIEKDENKLSELNAEYEEKFQELYDKITTVDKEINSKQLNDFTFIDNFGNITKLIIYIILYITIALFSIFIIIPLAWYIFVIMGWPLVT
jgi:hypothetical protein